MRTNCLFESIKYRLKNKGCKIKVTWNIKSKTPSFRVHHDDAIVRWRRIDRKQSRWLFNAQVEIIPMQRKKYIHVTSGDLLGKFQSGKYDAIAHGCNCQSSMSGGIARTISTMFPQIKQVDQNAIPRSYSQLETQFGSIYNLYTQIQPGANFDLELLKLSCDELNKRGMDLTKLNKKMPTLGVPQIGCGIGGGSWSQVAEVLAERLTYWKVEVVIYN